MRKDKLKKDRIILVGDTETSKRILEDESVETLCYLAGFTQARTKGTPERNLIVPKVERQRTIKDHVKALSKVAKDENAEIIIYYHNIGFDGVIIIVELLKEGYVLAHVDYSDPYLSIEQQIKVNESLISLLSDPYSLMEWDEQGNQKILPVAVNCGYGNNISLPRLLEVTGLTFEKLFHRYNLVRNGKHPFLLEYTDICKIIKAIYKDSNQGWYTQVHMPKKSFSTIMSADGLLYRIVVSDPSRTFIQMQDSFKIEGLALKTLCMAYDTTYKKKEMPYSEFRDSKTKLSKEVLEYFDNDVLSLAEIVGEFRDKGLTRLTAGSCALHEYKNTLQPERVRETLTEKNEIVSDWLEQALQAVEQGDSKKKGYSVFDVLFPSLDRERKELIGAVKNMGEYFRLFYTGAWTYVKEGLEGSVFNNGCTVDVNSLYPSVMFSESENKYPIGEPIEIIKGEVPNDIYRNDRVGFIEFTCQFRLKDGYLPTVQQKKHTLFQKSRWLTSSDDYRIKSDKQPYTTITGVELHNVRNHALEFEVRNKNNGLVLFTSRDETGKEFIKLTQEAPSYVGMNPHMKDFSKVFEWLERFAINPKKDLVITWFPIMRLYLTDNDFSLFLEHYHVTNLEITQVTLFEAYKGLFDDFLIEHRDGKINAKNGADKQFHKIQMNSLYGKFGTTSDASYKIPYLDESGMIKWKTVFDPKGKEAGYVPLASCITANARNFTIRAAQKNYNNFLYADTDSLHLSCNPEEIQGVTIHDKNFLCWKVETIFSKAIFWRPKAYMEIGKDGRIHLTFAGVSKKGKVVMLLSSVPYHKWKDIIQDQMGSDSIILQDLTTEQMFFLLGSQKTKEWVNIIESEHWDIKLSESEIRKEIEKMYQEHGIKRKIGALYNLFTDIQNGYTAPIKTVAKLVKGGKAILDVWYTFKLDNKKGLCLPQHKPQTAINSTTS